MNPAAPATPLKTLPTPGASRTARYRTAIGCALAGLLLITGCGEGEDAKQPAEAPPETAQPAPAPKAAGFQKPALPDDLPMALVLSLSVFPERKPGDEGPPVPLPAELEFITRQGGEWVKTTLTDSDSNVFHKAMVYTTPNGEQGLLTAAGSKGMLKLWTRQDGELVAETLWEKDFGGRFSRMRDLEVGDIDGDGSNAIAVATHDQGVVAIVRPQPDGGYAVEEIDHEKDTFVHEIEIGDLDGDGVMEVYATPSEPNKLDGSLQSCDDATECWVSENQLSLLRQLSACNGCHLRIYVAPRLFDWFQNSDLLIRFRGDCFKVCTLLFRSQAIDKPGQLGMLARAQAAFGIAQRLQVYRREAVVMVRRK